MQLHVEDDSVTELFPKNTGNMLSLNQNQQEFQKQSGGDTTKLDCSPALE